MNSEFLAALTDFMNQELIAAIDRTSYKRRMEENSQRNSGAWMRCPSDVRLQGRVYSAALRFRFGVLPVYAMNSRVSCDCGFDGTPIEWQEHVAVCARRTGKNASTTHAFLKEQLKRVLREDFKMCVEGNEPRQYKQILCAGCHAYISEARYDEHAVGCAGAQEKGRVHISGPDIRCQSQTGPLEDPVVFDVTVANPLCKSHGTRTTKATLAERKREKHALYGPMMKQSGDTFVVACVTATGNLDSDFVAFVKEHAKRVDAHVGTIVEGLACSVVASTASNLVAAERRYRQLA